jgi:hypothetical protein
MTYHITPNQTHHYSVRNAEANLVSRISRSLVGKSTNGVFNFEKTASLSLVVSLLKSGYLLCSSLLPKIQAFADLSWSLQLPFKSSVVPNPQF